MQQQSSQTGGTTMKPDIKYINKQKPRKTMSNISFKEDTVYPAHTLKTVGFVPYVNKSFIIDKLIEAKDYTGDRQALISKLIKDLNDL